MTDDTAPPAPFPAGPGPVEEQQEAATTGCPYEAIWPCYSYADEDTWVVECPSQNALSVGDNRKDGERLMTEMAREHGAWGVCLISSRPTAPRVPASGEPQ